MSREHAATAARKQATNAARLFTVDTANHALVFVRRVVQDIVDRYAELLSLRAEREDLASAIGSAERLELLRAEIEQRIERLSRLQEELSDVGCELKDYSIGLVDFPAQHNGRRVLLCWRLGEPTVRHWHEVDAGYSGRRSIEPGFE